MTLLSVRYYVTNSPSKIERGGGEYDEFVAFSLIVEKFR